MMCIVDEDGVGVGDVEARLDDRRSYQHVELAADEAQHHRLQLFPFHLTVGHTDADVGHDLADLLRHLVDVVHAVVDKEDLSAPVQLILDALADDLLVETVQLGDDGMTVGRRRVDDGQVARSHERKLQRTRYGRGREGEGVHLGTHLLELLLGRHAELLLLIDDQQSQVLVLHIFADETVCADEDVDLALCQAA